MAGRCSAPVCGLVYSSLLDLLYFLPLRSHGGSFFSLSLASSLSSLLDFFGGNGRLRGTHFLRFWLSRFWRRAAATACFWGRPDFIISLMFSVTVLSLVPRFRGIRPSAPRRAP